MTYSATGMMQPGYPLRSAYHMLGLLVTAYVVAFLDRQIIALLVAPIRASLEISDFQVGLLQGPAFSLAFCLATLPAGIIATC